MDKILNSKVFNCIVKVFESLLFLIILGYLVFVIAQRVSGNGSIFGYRVFTVASGSMNPKYVINDVIVVKDIDPDELKVGDDIAYTGERGGLEGILVSHRIIKIDKTGDELVFYTKGINNSVSDPSITSDSIMGKVIGKLPVINTVNHVIKNQFGFFFLIFCPLVLVIFLEIMETVTSMKEVREEYSDTRADKIEITRKKELSEEKINDNDIVKVKEEVVEEVKEEVVKLEENEKEELLKNDTSTNQEIPEKIEKSASEEAIKDAIIVDDRDDIKEKEDIDKDWKDKDGIEIIKRM